MRRIIRLAALVCAVCALVSAVAADTYGDYVSDRLIARDNSGTRLSVSGVSGLGSSLLAKTIPTRLAADRLDENIDGSLNAADMALLKRRLLTDPDTMMKSHFGSTFIEGWLANDFSEEQWTTTIDEWKAVGITSVIIGETCVREASGEINTFYASELVNASENAAKGGKMHYDSVDKILSHCQSAGIKCFVSMGTDSSFWKINICRHDSADGSGREGFIASTQEMLPYMSELYEKYAAKYPDAFYGWYFTPEISNSADYEDTAKLEFGVETLSRVLDIYIDEINRLDDDMPLMLSPYVNIKEEATWCTHDPAVLSGFWQSVMERAAFRRGDILAPQDSVGAGGMQLEQLAQWTRAYRTAVDNAGKGMELWSNAESFRFYLDCEDRSWAELTQSAFTATLIQQLELAEPYVDNFTSCSFATYYNTVSAGSGFFNSYMHYLRYGVTDAQPPESPTQFTADTVMLSGEEKPALLVGFSGASDNFGIARAEIYVDDAFFTYRTATRLQTWENNRYSGISEPQSFFDRSFDLENGTRVYTLVLYDCTGNRSEPVSVRVTAEGGQLSVTVV